MKIQNEIKISIIITTYNNGKFLEKCIDSAINQTYAPFEILVIDDGSVDDSKTIAEKYVSVYDGFIYYYQENSGVSVARNKGLELASGDYVMFVDGDDYLDLDILDKLKNEIGKNIDIACCCCHAFSDLVTDDFFFSESFTAYSNNDKEKLFLQLLNGNVGKPNGKGFTAIGVPWGKLYSIEFLNKNNIRFDPQLRRMQDNMFNMYAFYFAKGIRYINKPLYYYRLDHIKDKNTIYNPEVWRKLLLARKKFINVCQPQFSIQIKNAMEYERNVAFAASLMYICKKESKTHRKTLIKKLQQDELYNSLFSNVFQPLKPIKFFLIRLCVKCRLYIIINICLSKI